MAATTKRAAVHRQAEGTAPHVLIRPGRLDNRWADPGRGAGLPGLHRHRRHRRAEPRVRPAPGRRRAPDGQPGSQRHAEGL